MFTWLLEAVLVMVRVGAEPLAVVVLIVVVELVDVLTGSDRLSDAVLVMVRVGAHPVTVTIVASPLVCESVWSESTEAVLDSWPQVFGVVAWMVTTTSS